MDLDHYLTLSMKTESVIARDPTTEEKQLIHAALGLSTEVGEAVDLIKKHYFYGKHYTREQMVEEMGDIMWYMAILCRHFGATFEEIADANIAKLSARYRGRGFDSALAIERDMQRELAAMRENDDGTDHY